jgi:NAD(P)-dependent dehydrogenase (short-subunit alcohol dehydrogenase family)
MNGKRLEGRISLITGASRGIGRAVALRFAQEGARLILVSKSSAGLEEVDDEVKNLTNQSATLVPIDMTKYDEIDKLGGSIYKRFGKLDILIGNAAILGPLSPMGHIKARDWGSVMDTNLTANWRLLRSCDKLLRLSEAGRCVFVTSTVGHTPKAYWSAYAVSKAGLEMMTRIYAEEVAGTEICANILNPGKTRTTMREIAMPGEDPQALKTPDKVTEPFVLLAESSCTHNGVMMDEHCNVTN